VGLTTSEAPGAGVFVAVGVRVGVLGFHAQTAGFFALSVETGM